jgi:hypothetical protein
MTTSDASRSPSRVRQWRCDLYSMDWALPPQRLSFLITFVFALSLSYRLLSMLSNSVEALSPSPSLHSDLVSLSSEMSFESTGQDGPLVAPDAEAHPDAHASDDVELPARWKTHPMYSKPDWTVRFLVRVAA